MSFLPRNRFGTRGRGKMWKRTKGRSFKILNSISRNGKFSAFSLYATIWLSSFPFFRQWNRSQFTSRRGKSSSRPRSATTSSARARDRVPRQCWLGGRARDKSKGWRRTWVFAQDPGSSFDAPAKICGSFNDVYLPSPELMSQQSVSMELTHFHTHSPEISADWSASRWVPIDNSLISPASAAAQNGDERAPNFQIIFHSTVFRDRQSIIERPDVHSRGGWRRKVLDVSFGEPIHTR